MVITQRLTPESFVRLPRRGVVVPNRDGTLGLYNVSTYESGKGTRREWRVMDIDSGSSWLLTDDDKVHDVKWLPDHDGTIAWLRSATNGFTQLAVVCIGNTGELKDHYTAAEFDAPVQHLKLKGLDGWVAFAVVGLAGKDGSLYNEETTGKMSTARIYDDLNVRGWDTYIKPRRHAIFYSALVTGDDGRLTVAGPLRNAVRRQDLEAPAGMYQPEDPADNYDLCEKGIVFVACDPKPVHPRHHATSDVYFVPVDSWTAMVACRPVKLTMQTDHVVGYASNPRFSPDGSMVAYLKKPFANPADTRLLMGHVSSLSSFDVWKMCIGSAWDLAPSSFEYSPHGQSVLILADDCGRRALYELELRYHAAPRLLMGRPSVHGYHLLNNGNDGVQLLVSASSMLDNSVYMVIDTTLASEPRVISSATRHGQKLGLSHSQVSEIWFAGSAESFVQGWLTKPSNFDPEKKWPVVLQVHDGPEDAARDEWHWRWNSVLWAEQGYVVVCPNFTGSVGFGVGFNARAYGSGLDYPYQDLVNCLESLAEIPYIDTDRAVLAGGGYGGYMVNWIMGQPLAKKFKTMICHGPVFDTRLLQLYQDGVNERNSEDLEKWNPARPDLLRNWKDAPPVLVIHGDKDYRYPVTDGLSVFKTLQGLGVRSRFLSFPDEGHWVINPENALVWHRTVFEWMEQWVGKGPTGTEG